jgi:hypothetical protein
MPANEVMVRVDSIAQSEWEGMRQAGASQKLPNAKASDSGKVVSVNSSGKYVLAEPSGGSVEPLICTYGIDALDTTIGDIYQAFMSGRMVLFHGNTNEDDERLGNFGMLETLYISGDDEYGYHAELGFEGAGFTTDPVETIDLLMNAYPFYQD